MVTLEQGRRRGVEATESYRVLILEDDPLAAKLVKSLLDRHLGQRISMRQVESLKGAISLASRIEFDVILLDLNLPDSEGLQTLASFLREVPEATVIVLTGNDDDELGLEAIQMGAQDYLVKGEYKPRTLVRSLRYAKERHRTLSALQRLAVIDELTGIYNRRGFFSLVREIYDGAVRENRQSAFVVFFDLDRFKHYNDTYGHEMGDRVLKVFAESLKRSFFRKDVIARFGGDEFVAFGLFKEKMDLEKTFALLRKELTEASAHAELPEPILFSAGTFIIDGDPTISLDSAMMEADRELYRVKRESKHRHPNPVSSDP